MTAQCCCCGFKEKHGVFFGKEVADGLVKFFMCERCFTNPHVFNVAKVDFSELIFKIRYSRKINPFGKPAPDGSPATELVFASKKAKREIAAIENFYKGQKQLEVFA
jgi:hypothetical protein